MRDVRNVTIIPRQTDFGQTAGCHPTPNQR